MKKMQKSRLCAQGVRLAWHYACKTLLGGPKDELALAKLMLCHFPEKLPSQPVSHRVADKGRGLSLSVSADLLVLLIAGTVNLATLAGATNKGGKLQLLSFRRCVWVFGVWHLLTYRQCGFDHKGYILFLIGCLRWQHHFIPLPTQFRIHYLIVLHRDIDVTLSAAQLWEAQGPQNRISLSTLLIKKCLDNADKVITI